MFSRENMRTTVAEEQAAFAGSYDNDYSDFSTKGVSCLGFPL